MLPGEVLGRRIGEAPIEFGAVPFGDGHLLSGGRNTVPNRLDEMQSVAWRQPEDFLQELIVGHVLISDFRRAVACGTAAASICCEQFSVDGLEVASRNELDARMDLLRRISQF